VCLLLGGVWGLWGGGVGGASKMLCSTASFAPVPIAASAGHTRIATLSGNFCNGDFLFKSKRATLTRRARWPSNCQAHRALVIRLRPAPSRRTALTWTKKTERCCCCVHDYSNS